MFKKAPVSSSLSLSLLLLILYLCLHVNGDFHYGPLLPKEKRVTIVSTEYGEISAARVGDGGRTGCYHLQFFTMEPNSLFLPVLLHTDMVFYVHTGSGKLNWVDEDEGKPRLIALRRGDVYRLKPGSVFYLQSNLEAEREKLRIYAIFDNSEDGDLNEESSIGAYSSISDLVRGFDKKVLEAAFEVPEELIEAITNATKPPAIVHDVTATKKKNMWGWEARFLKAFIGSQGHSMYDLDLDNKKKADKTFNIRDAHPDVKNCNGRALTVTHKDMKVLKGSRIGIFMVNLTKGSMMGPHWNPMATEIAVVTEGEGMVRVVCSSGNGTTNSSSINSSKYKCENRRFRVEEGDIFVVPRFHPMAQMSFNNGSLVFMGFSTASKLNHPQFLAGKRSVLRTLDKNVLAAAFNVSNTTMDQLLTPQGGSIILDCTSCAEDEARIMDQEIEKQRQEEEEARKREEEEEKARKREEEEEARKREQEKEEEARKREEEEEAARKREEEEEAARKREEEEEARKREEEEEAARKREEEEEARKREEEEEAARKREEEEEAEAAAKKREEEEADRRRREAAAEREQEEAKRQEEERQKREREEEDEAKARKREEEEVTKEEDRRREAEAEREQEEAMRGEEKRQEREKEEVKYEIGGGGEGKMAE